MPFVLYLKLLCKFKSLKITNSNNNLFFFKGFVINQAIC